MEPFKIKVYDPTRKVTKVRKSYDKVRIEKVKLKQVEIEQQFSKLIIFLSRAELSLSSKTKFTQCRSTNLEVWNNEGFYNEYQQLMFIRKYAIWLNHQLKSINNSPFAYNKSKLTNERLNTLETILKRILINVESLSGVTMEQVITFTRGRFDVDNSDKAYATDYGKFLELAIHANSCYLNVYKNLPQLLKQFGNKNGNPDLLSYAVIASLSRYLDPSSKFIYSDIYNNSIQNIELMLPKVYNNPTHQDLRGYLNLMDLYLSNCNFLKALKFFNLAVSLAKTLGVPMKSNLNTDTKLELLKDNVYEEYSIVWFGFGDIFQQLKLTFKDRQPDLPTLPNYFSISFFLAKLPYQYESNRVLPVSCTNKIFGASTEIINTCKTNFNSNLQLQQLNLKLRIQPNKLNLIYNNLISLLPNLNQKISYEIHINSQAYLNIGNDAFIKDTSRCKCHHFANVALYYSIYAYNATITLLYPCLLINPIPTTFPNYELEILLKAAHYQSLLYLYSASLHLQSMLQKYSNSNSNTNLHLSTIKTIKNYLTSYPQPTFKQLEGNLAHNVAYNRYSLSHTLFNELMFSYFIYLNTLITLPNISNLNNFFLNLIPIGTDNRLVRRTIEINLKRRVAHILATYELFASFSDFEDNFNCEPIYQYVLLKTANF